MILDAVTIVIFTVVIYKCKTGTRFSFVYLIGGLILCENVSGMIEESLKISSQTVTADFKTEYPIRYYLTKSFNGIEIISFALAMYLLAHRYHQISVEIPFIIKGESVPDNFWLNKWTFLSMIALNIAAGVFDSITKS